MTISRLVKGDSIKFFVENTSGSTVSVEGTY